jgi:hypothetical protein
MFHETESFAKDIRVVRVYLKSKGGQVENFSLGSPSVTRLEGPGFISAPTTGKLVAPMSYYAPKFGLVVAYVKEALFGEPDQNIALMQEYLFTSYGKDPSHEPSGALSATRVYPLLHFDHLISGPIKQDNLLEGIRVDYRVEFKMNNLGSAETPNLLPNQIGVWKDHDKPFPLSVVPYSSGTTELLTEFARQIFQRAEKPLLFEIVGQGISHGTTSDWDNIHQWSASETGELPPTPGVPRGIHTHWRWARAASEPSVALPGGSPHFGGHRGPGTPIIDGKIANQDLKFAIVKRTRARAIDNRKIEPDEQFDGFERIFTRLSSQPDSIGKVRRMFSDDNIVIYLSFTVSSGLTKPEKMLLKGNEQLASFAGSFFVHGIFFAHESLDVLPFTSKIIPDAFDPQYVPGKPKPVWRR